MTTFKKAVKYESKLRLALIGPSGSGKTMTGLILASRLAEHYGGRVAVIDTERGSASKYADAYDFDVLELANYHPQQYIDAILAAEQAGYNVALIDSLSHAWIGKGGALEMVDTAAKKSSSGNSFAAWRDVTPLHNRMVDTMTSCGLHLIVTMRSKMDYVQTQDERGRTVIRKVGMQPVQRDGLEYEFDVVADMDLENNLIVSKTRCAALAGLVINQPDGSLSDQLHAWLAGETPPPMPEPRQETAQPPAQGQKKPNPKLEKLKALDEVRYKFDPEGNKVELVNVDELHALVSARFDGRKARDLDIPEIDQAIQGVKKLCQVHEARHTDAGEVPMHAVNSWAMEQHGNLVTALTDEEMDAVIEAIMAEQVGTDA